MLASRPLAENTQMSAVTTPLPERSKGTGFPASEHELFAVENTPSAATFKSRSLPGTETPAVVGSTTTISFAVAAGATLDNEITSSELFCAATTRETLLEVVASGLRICTATLPTAPRRAPCTCRWHRWFRKALPRSTPCLGLATPRSDCWFPARLPRMPAPREAQASPLMAARSPARD